MKYLVIYDDRENHKPIGICATKEDAQDLILAIVEEKEYNKEKDYTVKQSINDKKKIDCFDLDGNYLRTYNSINETKSDGFSPKNVQSVCKGRKKTHLKHVFKYHNKI